MADFDENGDFNPKLCRCGSGEHKYELLDAAGIFCTYVCSKCEDAQMAKFNPTIFDGKHPYASSGKEEDLEIDYDFDPENY